MGHANETPVVMDGHEVAALVDLGAQVSNISAQLCEDLGLEIQPLGCLLELEGTGGAAIPYLRFVEVNLQIPGIRGYNEDVLLLSIPTTAYAEGVLVVVGSKIIDRALSCMTAGELACATATWQQAHFGAVMLGSLQLSCSSSDKLKIGNSSRENDPVEVQKSPLDGIKGAVCTTQKVTIPPFQTVYIKANASVKGHCMRVHVLTEPALGPQLPAAVGTHSRLWRVTPWLFEGTSLPMQYEHSCCGDTSQNHGWSGNPYQPSTNGGSPNEDCQRDHY